MKRDTTDLAVIILIFKVYRTSLKNISSIIVVLHILNEFSSMIYSVCFNNLGISVLLLCL